MSVISNKQADNQKALDWLNTYTFINFDNENVMNSSNQEVEIPINEKRLVIDKKTLDTYLSGKSKAIKNYIKKRLKLLLDTCSKDVKKGKVTLETVNRLAAFCIETIPLIESNSIVMPIPKEFVSLVKWYIDKTNNSHMEPGDILTTVCPDYPYEYFGGRAVYKEGELGEDIGLVGESILKTGAKMVSIFVKTLGIPLNWIIGYAGFEGKKENLGNMNINSEIFFRKLKESASKLQKELGISVGIMPDIVGISNEEFWGMRNSFSKEQFSFERKGMNALAHATDMRDWACIYSIANKLNAIILDGASVYVGRRAYKNTEKIIKSEKYTPTFYCITNYEGYAE